MDTEYTYTFYLYDIVAALTDGEGGEIDEELAAQIANGIMLDIDEHFYELVKSNYNYYTGN